MQRLSIKKTDEFNTWYLKQPLKVQLQIDGRLQRIIDNHYFGHIKELDEVTKEIKFNNGNRIYYIKIEELIIILITAGNKNTQNKDIKKAKQIAKGLYEKNKSKKT